MRRFLLLGSAAFAIVSGSVAQAAMPVVDISAILRLREQLTKMAQQYATMQQTYAAIAHLPSTASSMIQSNLDPFRNPLPAPGTTGSMMNGGLLGPLAGSYLSRNRVYAPTGTDFQSTEMARKAKGIANAMALASQLFASSSGRIDALRAMESQLTRAPDEKAVLDISARVQAEHAYIQAAQVQAQSLALVAATEQRNEEQRQDELRLQSIDNLIAQARAHGG